MSTQASLVAPEPVPKIERGTVPDAVPGEEFAPPQQDNNIQHPWAADMKPLTFPILLVLGIAVFPGTGAAAPFIPKDDDQVLERLPYRSVADPLITELRQLRAELAQDPQQLDLAVYLAWRYIELGRGEGDPRYHGYAQAVLQPWWDQAQPPPQVLLLRATLRQNRHDFTGALRDLAQLLRVNPRDVQAWLTRAVILTVRGDYADALQSCLPLTKLADTLLATACVSNAASLSGQAEASYRLLYQVLQRSPSASTAERLWALTVLAEIAARLGHHQAADQHFRQALVLNPRDSYLLAAFADFLLDQDRPEAVQTLLKDNTRPDTLLLRLALAEQRLKAPQLEGHLHELRARFTAARLRGDNLHLGSEARFILHLLHKPGEALPLTQQNWALQREPADARLVLEAALAAENLEAARPVLDWLEEAKLEDIQLQRLVERLKDIPP